MQDAFAAFCFAAVVLAALALHATPPGHAGRQRRVRLFVAVIVAASLAPALLQRELWPFSRWPYAANPATERVVHARLVAVDAQGREHAVDHRAWEPLTLDELTAWLWLRFPQLSPEQQHAAMRSLLVQAESGRQRARTGSDPGRFRRWLGPLAAPTFLLHPARWSSPTTTPQDALVALRLYREQWDVEGRARGGRPARQLMFEVRAR